MILKLLLLSSKDKDPNEASIVAELFENGLDVFHLRKPGLSTRQMEEYLEQIPPRFWSQIVIHSHYKLAFKYNLKGIHVGKDRRNSKFFKSVVLRWYKIKRPELKVSTSFHHLASLFEENYPYDYVMLSPVFDSISKSGYQSGFSHSNLSIAIKKSRYKIIALGGIDLDKVSRIKEMQFDGMMLSGAIWQQEHPVENFTSIRKKVNELNREQLA